MVPHRLPLPFLLLLLPACCGLGQGSPYQPSAAVTAAFEDASTDNDPALELILFAAPGDTSDVLVRPYLEQLAEGDGVTLSVVDHATEPELTRELRVRSNGTLVFRAGERTENIRLGTTAERVCRMAPVLDGRLLQVLERLRSEACPITLVSGEPRKLSSLTQLFENLDHPVRDIGLFGDWPDPTCIAVAAGPLDAGADSQLASHVAAGGHLLFLTDDEGEDTAVLDALGMGRGEHLLAHDTLHAVAHGVAGDKRLLVTDEVAPHRAVGTVSRNTRLAPLVIPDALNLRPGPGATAIIRGKAGTYEDRDGDLIVGPDEALDEVVLGVAIEREDGGRAAVLGSASMFDDAVLPAAQGNMLLAVDLVAWLAGLPEVDLALAVVTGATEEQERACTARAPDAPEPFPVLAGGGEVTALRWSDGTRSLTRVSDERGSYVQLELDGTTRTGRERAAQVMDDLVDWKADRALDLPDERRAEIGLDPPEMTVEVERGDGIQTIRVGGRPYGQNDPLIAIDEQILVAPGGQTRELERAGLLLADPWLTPLDRDSAVSITVHRPDGTTLTLTDPGSVGFQKLIRLRNDDGPAPTPAGEPALRYEVRGADASWPVELYPTEDPDLWVARSAWHRGDVPVPGNRVKTVLWALGLSESR